MRIGVLTEGSSQHLQLEAFFLSVEGSLVHNVCNLPGVLWIAGKKPINAHNVFPACWMLGLVDVHFFAKQVQIEMVKKLVAFK